MMSFRVVKRVITILRVCHHWRLLDIHQHDALRRVAFVATILFFWQGRCDRALPRGERLKNALIELGPIFVKFGQMLSTRRDLLALDIADALSALQDKVPPVEAVAARKQIEQSWSCTISEKLAEFDENALASASVAAVAANWGETALAARSASPPVTVSLMPRSNSRRYSGLVARLAETLPVTA